MVQETFIASGNVHRLFNFQHKRNFHYSSSTIFIATQNKLSIMTLALDYSSASTAIVTAVIIGSGIALLSIMPIFLTGLYYYLNDIWGQMIQNRKNYLHWNRQRKEWNKKAAIEIRRQFITGFILTQIIQERGIGIEDCWRYKSMVSNYSNKSL
jgi:hypothetical protein